jgi:hypothetical protein
MRTCGVIPIVAMVVSQAVAQQPILSPRDSVFLSLDTNNVSVNYGRPSMRGRKIMGGLVPWNAVWRTGANEATHFKTNFDMTLGGVPVPRGTYTLWTLPSPAGWKIILNKQTGQWGTKYDERLDYARFDAHVEQLPAPIETLTVALEATGRTSGVIKLMWENTLVSAPFEKNNHIRPVSPLDSTMWTADGKTVKVRFSKPYQRGRRIWGVVVPFDTVWRTGANAATVLQTESDLTMGGVPVPKGVYTVYSVPSEKSFTLIVSEKPPGAAEYDRTKDVARIHMKMATVKRDIDPFAIWFEPEGSDAATLKLGWADRVYETDVRTHY